MINVFVEVNKKIYKTDKNKEIILQVRSDLQIKSYLIFLLIYSILARLAHEK
jgi:hypothetical protein